jgi:hypothetical protein
MRRRHMGWFRSVLCALIVWRAPASAQTAGDMYRDCQALSAGVQGQSDKIAPLARSDANQCWGFIRAVQQYAVLADGLGKALLGACPPTETKTTTVLFIFVDTCARIQRRVGCPTPRRHTTRWPILSLVTDACGCLMGQYRRGGSKTQRAGHANI